jgi:hypothetical protein
MVRMGGRSRLRRYRHRRGRCFPPPASVSLAYAISPRAESRSFSLQGPTPGGHLGAPPQNTIVLSAARAHVYADDQEQPAHPRHRAEPP